MRPLLHKMDPNKQFQLSTWAEHPATQQLFSWLRQEREAAVTSAVNLRKEDPALSIQTLERVSVLDSLLTTIRSGDFFTPNQNPA